MHVQVLDDLEFVKAACEHQAPGATNAEVGWTLKMVGALGRKFCGAINTPYIYSMATDWYGWGFPVPLHGPAVGSAGF